MSFINSIFTLLLLSMPVDTPHPVQGYCAPEFKPVQTAFEAIVASDLEIGAAIAVYYQGKPVVDLWGGFQNKEQQKPWEKDTVVCMMSVTKAMAALCVHILADQGKIELDAPVVRYWPEFGQNGKEDITVRQLIGHHAGLIFADAATKGEYYNWDAMAKALAAQKPEWPAGTKGAYHSSTYGFLAGELVRRVSGKSLGTFFREEITNPLDIDFHIGLKEEEIARKARFYINWDNISVRLILKSGLSTKVGRAWKAFPKDTDDPFNNNLFLKSELPSANGHGNARAMARIYSALATDGTINGKKLLSPDAIEQVRRLQWDEKKGGMTGRPWRMASGFFLNSPETMPMGPNPNNFGHAGMGGSLGFADPDKGLGFGFSPNFMNAGGGIGAHRERLIAVLYSCLK